MATNGVVCDSVTEGINQLCYLPNPGPEYAFHQERGDALNLAGHLLNEAARALFTQMNSEAEAAKERRKAAYTQRTKETGNSFIAAYRRRHPTLAVLEEAGFVTKDGVNWRHPVQESARYGTQLHEDGSLYTFSATVGAWGGKPSGRGWYFSDGYDLAKHLLFGDDAAAIEAYARQCLADERAIFEAHGRWLWEGCTHVGGVPRRDRPTESGVPLFDLSFVTGTEETAVIEYYIDPWLPKATVVGAYGRGESGKSSFFSTMCALASDRVSTLWVSSEEEVNNIGVRYTQSGGELNTLIPVSSTPRKTGSETVTVFDVYEHLERTIQDVQHLQRPDRPLGIVVLDAIGALVTWKKGENANDDGSVKRLIAHIHSLSMRYGLTIVIIGHLNKNTNKHHGADAVTGSAAWTNSVRRAFMFYKDDLSGDDYNFFARTAKANTGTHFAASYRTVPVHTIHARGNGACDEVLCCTQFTSDIVWGSKAVNDLVNDGEEAPEKVSARKKSEERTQARLDAAHEAIKAGCESREAIIAWVTVRMKGLSFNPAHFSRHLDADLQAFRKVKIETLPHNKMRYSC